MVYDLGKGGVLTLLGEAGAKYVIKDCLVTTLGRQLLPTEMAGPCPSSLSDLPGALDYFAKNSEPRGAELVTKWVELDCPL